MLVFILAVPADPDLTDGTHRIFYSAEILCPSAQDALSTSHNNTNSMYLLASHKAIKS